MIISRRKQPSLLVTPLNSKHVWRGCTPTRSILESGLPPPSTAWSIQVSEVCKNASQQVGILYPSLCKYVITLVAVPGLHLATSGVCITCMGSHQQGLITSLERVQKFALKVCTKNWNSDYESLHQLYNLPTLASRRHYLKLCLLYQVVNEHINFPLSPIVP